MRLCAITDRQRQQATPGEASLHGQLKKLVNSWIEGGVNFIQLREKDLDHDALASLIAQLAASLDRRSESRFLVNAPASAAPWLAAMEGVDGLHLPGKPVFGSVEPVRQAFRVRGRIGIVSLACHNLEDIGIAREEHADFALYAPVFGKQIQEKVAGAAMKTTSPPHRDLFHHDVFVHPQDGSSEDAPSRSSEDATDCPSGLPAVYVQGLDALGLDALAQACEAAGEMPVFALGGVTIANAPKCEAAGAAGVAGIRLFAGRDWRALTCGN